ncbi:MAG TPA: AI-2E family transporter [Cyclobacteriaceae bacterium]
MNSNAIKSILILVLIIALGWYFSNIFLYISISLVIATILRPLTNYINKIQLLGSNVPRFLAIIISFGSIIFIICLFILLFVPLISEQVEIISKVDFIEIYTEILKPLAFIESFLIENDFTNEPEGFIVNSLGDTFVSSFTNIDFTRLLNNVLSLTGTFFITLLAITFITFFLLFENGILRRQIISLIPNRYFEVFIVALFKIEKLLSNYLLGLLFQMFSIFTLASIGLSIFSINYAITIAVFAAVANLIPYLGPLLGGAFGIVVGISTAESYAFSFETGLLSLQILSVFVVVQVTDNVLLQPLIFSRSVKAHPLEIFVIIFAGATIAGIPGMIAAIPVYTIIRVSALEVYKGYKSYQIFKL